MTDEEFMREAYIRGFGSLDSAWVAEMFKRLQKAQTEQKHDARQLELPLH